MTTLGNHQLASPLLAEKADALRASSLFTNPSHDSEMAEKQSIFLVLAGLKPVSKASSCHWEPTQNGRRTVFDDPKEVAAFLESLGLSYQLRHDEHATDALISLNAELLVEYSRATGIANEESYSTVGKLFGYPATAAEAFAHYAVGDEEKYLLAAEEQDKIEHEGGLGEKYCVNFRFSKAHWPEELKTCLQWQEVLQLYSLL